MIYLLGGSGAPNFGDELMMHHWLRYIHERGADAWLGGRPPLVVDNISATVSSQLFGSRFPHTRFISVLKKIRHPERSKNLMDNLAYGFEFFSAGHYKQHPDVLAILPLLEQTKLLHVYGGGYINASSGVSGGLLLGLVADAKRTFGMRLVATGLGLSPFNVDKDRSTTQLSQVVESFDVLETRDFHGFQQVKRLVGAGSNLLCGHDDSLLFPVSRNPARIGHRKLHLSSTKGSIDLEHPAVVKAIRANLREFDELIYWQCAPHVEGPVIERLTARFPSMKVATVEELLFDGAPVDEGDYMVTVRFHPHMVASRLGCSGQYFADAAYYEHKHGSVAQLGSRFALHDPAIERFESVEQPIAWREAAHVALKRELANRIYAKL